MINEFLRYCKNELQLSDHTVAAYRNDLLQWQKAVTEGGRYELRPADTTLSDLRLWLGQLGRNGMKQRTIRRKIQSLRAFFKFMMARHDMPANPARDLVAPKIARELPVYVRSEEMKNLLDDDYDHTDATEVRNHLILDMFYSTGLRCSELMTLLDVNVDTLRGELKVHGKRNKDRIVPFGPELSQMIEEYRNIRDNDPDMTAGETLFCRADGRPMSRKQIYNVVHRAMEQSGVHSSRKSPHVLRHSFATDMLNGGAELTSVQQLLGHESLTATQIYTHISYRDLKQNYQLAHPRAQKKGG
ncbi:MAG: tyrosine-type recombinase/integrase [Bacteroides sp.]|nr:tyrosine-type recombinase/integrase [Bacteroides sp.]MCM1412946.1 tyrosine-type recombinase/integrase [Bacteroides sp.]MCM1471611.1 tyrosine-type recombinase/integrase [Bacteroides sp.]